MKSKTSKKPKIDWKKVWDGFDVWSEEDFRPHDYRETRDKIQQLVEEQLKEKK